MFLASLEQETKKGKLSPKLNSILTKFYASYKDAVNRNGHSIEEYEPVLESFLKQVIYTSENLHPFGSYHERIRTPFDYYQLGLDMLRPLVIFEKSKVKGFENLKKVETQLSKGENAIFLANHQTEPDPQAISLLLEKTHPILAEKMIFVAGDRVVSDPLAIPMSLGRNLLCIFSKKHIENPPEKKEEKQLHNQRTMKKMAQLLSEGGKCIYVAPSGGRDRPNTEGVVEVAKFDPQSIEMFWLISQQADRPTHFYPLTLATYHLLPPPNSTEKDIGEKRQAQCTPIHLAFGSEIDMEHFPGSEVKDKRLKRKNRADYICDLVRKDYADLLSTQ